MRACTHAYTRVHTQCMSFTQTDACTSTCMCLLPCSPKQIWHIHRDMLWHPSGPAASSARAPLDQPTNSTQGIQWVSASPSCSPAAQPASSCPLGMQRSSSKEAGAALRPCKCPIVHQQQVGALPPLRPAHVRVMVRLRGGAYTCYTPESGFIPI